MTITAFPTLPLLSLSDDDQMLVQRLNNLRAVRLPRLALADSYYNGTQLIRDLGIAIPPQVRGLSVAVGWPQVAVDAVDERLEVQGFRYAGSPAGDDTLNGIWQMNDLASESPLGHLEALIHGQSFACVGTNDDGSPLVTVESLRDISVIWDPRWRALTAALRVYGGDEYGRHLQATFYTPNATIFVGQNDSGEWDIIDRDDHNIGQVLVARLPNRQRVSDRDGRSEITAQMMSLTDSACRTLLGLEVSREFFIAPKLVLIGASESAFVDPQGNPKSAWQTYIGRVLGLEANEDGTLPQVHQLAQMDPTAFKTIMDIYRQEMAALTKLPPYMLGETTQNPASADAIRSAENGLIKKVEQRQRAFGAGWRTAMQLALAVTGNGVIPADAHKIEAVWANAATPTPAATADALTKYIQVGALPAISDVVREKAGFSVAERERLAEDDKTNLTEEFIDQVASALEAKAARTTKSLVADATQPAAPVLPAPTKP